MKKQLVKENSGITLVALIITIIVLLILAGITIYLVFGENGILNRTKESAIETRAAEVEEKSNLWKTEVVMNRYTKEISKTADEIIQELYDKKLLTKQEYDKLMDKEKNSERKIAIGKKEIDFKIEVSNNLQSDGTYDGAVNSPKLGNKMSAIIYDATTGETSTPTTNEEWYEYKKQTDTTENGGDSRWANAKTEDGSLWVWIPRYSYKITYYTDNTHIAISKEKTLYGTIDIKFSKGITDDISDGYQLHPAFTFGDKEVAGIWVAKFEMSGETNGIESMPGDVLTSDSIKMVSKPQRSSWRNISVSNIFNNSYNYSKLAQSHMMKNIEWGVCAYLAHSAYGRNGIEVTINNNSKHMTGYGGDTISAYDSDNTEISQNKWTGEKGKLASTTGNIYGIYDMSGGAWEYVAGNLIGYIGSAGNTGEFNTIYNSTEVSLKNKYLDFYTYSGTPGEDGREINYQINNSKIGDALYETSIGGTLLNSWFTDYSSFISSNYPWFRRGGLYYDGSNAGLFFFSGDSGYGNSSNISFRVVLIIE